MPGTATTNLPLSDSADDVIGNAAGSTVRVSMARLAAQLGTLQGPAYASVTQLQEDTAWPAGAIGSVYGGTAAQTGVYRKNGAPGTGSWSRIGDLQVSSLTAAQLASKADIENSTKSFPSRAVAVSVGQAAIPASLVNIFTREGDYLVLRQASQETDDPLFGTAPHWGVVARYPAQPLIDDLAASKADQADLASLGLVVGGKADIANSTKSFPSRAAAVSVGQAAIPASLVNIFTREGDYLVLRQASRETDDPLFGVAPHWGVIARYPAQPLIDALAASQTAEALQGYRANLGNFVGVGIAAGPVPIVVSADNRVLISGDVMSRLTHYRLSLGEFLGQLPQNASPPAMVSADNRVLIGTGGSASIPTVNAIWTNDGQSNAEGSTDGSSSLVYPGETASVLTLARGARRDQWLGLATGGGDSAPLDGGQITAIAPMAVEMSALNHGTTAAEAAARAASRWGRAPIVIWSNAEGGQSIANLLPSPPAGYYGFSNTVTALERAQAVRSPGMRLVYEWMLMHQGESNTGASDLGLLHDQLRAAVDAEAKRILGQHEAVRMISWQPSSFSLSNGARSILQHALDHAEAGAFFCGGPSYGFPWYETATAASAAFLHHSSRGHAMRGEMAAAIIRRIESEGRYLPLHAVGAAITGANEITVTLSELAEAATDSVVQAAENLGITLTGASVSGAVVSGNQLIVTTTGAASAATAVNFGLLGQTNPRTEARIPRTNIRAKAPLGTYSWGGLIRAWMCHQTVAIS